MFLPGILADPQCLGCLSHATAVPAYQAHLPHLHWMPPPPLPPRQYLTSPLPLPPPPKPQRMIFRRRDSLPGPPPYQIARLTPVGMRSRSSSRASFISALSAFDNANTEAPGGLPNSGAPYWESGSRRSSVALPTQATRRSPAPADDRERRRSVTFDLVYGDQKPLTENASDKTAGNETRPDPLPALRILERDDVLAAVGQRRKDVVDKEVQCDIEYQCTGSRWPSRRKGPRLRLSRVWLARGLRSSGGASRTRMTEQHIPEGVAVVNRE